MNKVNFWKKNKFWLLVAFSFIVLGIGWSKINNLAASGTLTPTQDKGWTLALFILVGVVLLGAIWVDNRNNK